MRKVSVIFVLKKGFLIQVALITAIIFVVGFLFFRQQTNSKEKMTSNQIVKAPIGQNGLEPDIPQDIDDPPYFNPPMPSEIVPVSEVFAKGQEIPIKFIYNNPEWERKAYKEYWHSKFRRWSYVPYRLHYALHRLYTTYATASVYYDFIHNLGIAQESQNFEGYLPVPPIGKSQKVNPYENIQTVIMQTDVVKIITYENQVVLVGKPRRTGLQALVIPVKFLKPYDAEENMLFQLVTEEEDEIDYSLIGIVKFDESR